jgi:pimeloyl-ACP methyl ester carboxylesterase
MYWMGKLAREMMQELAENVTFELVPDSMHWIPEENPEGFVSLLTRWMNGIQAKQM